MASTACSIDPMAVSTTTAILELRPDPPFGQLGQQSHTVQPRHLQVGDHNGWFPGEHLLPGFDAVARGFGAVSPAGDQLRQPHQRMGLVFQRSGL